ncbi:MAG: membrane protein insertase YidC [Desulfobulbaceae bacterium]|nr:membrane protein insertase YidC [Desulfobulbaceae bacterium]
MDLYRAFLAIVLSFMILLGYQYFFVKPVPPAQNSAEQQVAQGQTDNVAPQPKQQQPASITPPPAQPAPVSVPVDPNARDITINTPLYSAVISEQGGGFKRFVLKKYRTEKASTSGDMELVKVEGLNQLPILFSLDNGAGTSLPVFHADREKLDLTGGADTETLTMKATLPGGLVLTRTLVFHADSYVIDLTYQVENTGAEAARISPALSLNSTPFAHGSSTSRYLFSGPASYVDQKLVQVKTKKLAEGPQVLQGHVSWTGYEDNYFINAVIPLTEGTHMVTIGGSADMVRTVVSEGTVSLEPKGTATYIYKMYFGPKKLTILKTVNYDLAKAINFGWFDVLAKPMLWLLNFFYGYIGNYGIAIILVTILIKGSFWPITQKGMKSMKNMQKLQPKVAKLKEKYKDDPTKMNQEMMAMYKTYKVNPIGGCLPMIIQIPFFFALYRVLMAAIELRHAPFMLWINDLSAPDRLMVGFDIPYIHGIPVLTLLMGASMYLQQKMTPTTADPTQAKVMQFLPVVFTFMFLNFASGLVLYWFVNNLLSILQQQLINRQVKA